LTQEICARAVFVQVLEQERFAFTGLIPVFTAISGFQDVLGLLNYFVSFLNSG
jgi:hypothetical protein